MIRVLKKAACIFIVVLMLISSIVSTSAYTVDDVVNAAVKLILSHEGVYTSILANDNGAVSLGKVGWHGPRALYLLQMIIEANESRAKEILGDVLYNEIISSEAVDWNYRVFTSEEKMIVEKLLATDESKTAQDQLAFNDIKGYIVSAQSMGITDGKALVFFADLHNQMGGGGSGRVAKAAIDAVGSGSNVTLRALYDAAMADSVAASSPSRRKSAYDYCLGLNFGEITSQNNFKTGRYKTTASSLRVRSGPSTSYDTVTSNISQGTVVTVTEVSGDWGKVSYNGKTGWISLLYADYVDVVTTPIVSHDLNGNGLVDASDARTVLRAAANMQTLTDSQKNAADVDGDGKITAADARMILRIAAKMQ